MRNIILIVDDEELNRELLKEIFRSSYEIRTASDGKEALVLYEKYKEDIAAILLDLIMPDIDGWEVLKVLYDNGATSIFPVILITANTDIDNTLNCFQKGAAEVIYKPFSTEIINQRVNNMIEMFSYRERLSQLLHFTEKKLVEKENQLEQFNDSFIDTISDVCEFRNVESGQHVKRVKGLTKILAQYYSFLFPKCGLNDKKIGLIVKASALHDIGKIVIPDKILLKPGKLNAKEREIIQAHTIKGCDILERFENLNDNTELYDIAYDIVRHHHERYDGNGYPDGLKGDEIPLSAQLVSVADVYDALTNERVYKKAYSKELAYNMIINGECGVFDPKLIRCLTYARETIEKFTQTLE